MPVEIEQNLKQVVYTAAMNPWYLFTSAFEVDETDLLNSSHPVLSV